MSSRLNRRTKSLCLVLLSQLMACGVFEVNDPTRTDDHLIEVGQGESGCLSRDGKSAKLFIAGDSRDDSGFHQIWGCLDQALDLFLRRVQGAHKDRYQRRELYDFLAKYFIEKSENFDEKHFNEVFEIKKALVGGSVEFLTRKEIQNLRDLIRVGAAHSQNLARHAPFLTVFARESDPEKVLDFARALSFFLGDFGRKMDSFGSSYSLEQAGKAATAIQSLLGSKSPKDLSDDFLRIIEFWKSAFVTTPAKEIRPGQWEQTLSNFSATLFLGGHALNFHRRNRNYFCDEALEEVELLLAHLSQAWNKMGEPNLSLSQIKELVKSLKSPSKYFGYQQDSVLELVNVLLSKLSSFDERQRQLTSFGRREIDGWIEVSLSAIQTQKLINQMAAQANPSFTCKSESAQRSLYEYKIPASEMLGFTDPDRPESKALRAIPKLLVTSRADRQIQRPLRDFFEDLLASRPLWNHPEVAYRISLLHRKKTEKPIAYSHLEISIRHLFWILNSKIFQSYSELPSDRRGLKNRLQMEDFHRLYLDTRNFGIERSWYDPGTFNAAELRHRESDLFMPSSNGNQFMELREAVELFTALISTRIFARDFHKFLLTVCPKDSEVDFTGYPPVDAQCMIRELFGSYQFHIAYYFPKLTQFYAKLDVEAQAAFRSTFESLFVPSGMLRSNYVISERIVALIQYEEMLLERFDLDQSGGIRVGGEFDAVYKLLSDLLEKALGPSTEERKRAILAYLFQYGKLPNSSRWAGLQFLWFESRPHAWNFHAKRDRIFEVMRVLSQAIPKKLPDKEKF